ncbi:hypothetical protein I5Q65_08090 [Pseudomonas aeruginosa]|uniref:Uncharacterized protein n=1 Tax=Pseudomonas phage JD18 TaxID=1225791 RepID=J9STK7_9CAUD|nr:tail assembly chaperone [Pseudomonas phage JD18]KSP48756.1 hypothetical protein APB19_25090 [Pseudomonas aeruginosa]AFR52194.1 hypothetical protein HMPREFV_HMPID9843gp0041 [Pseudomonas phage JD18]MBH3769042.1 hypothetical protein [Pseudomonas aeruginosa]MCS7791673.1 hypothetical protein [Pseudomonas aeruginosa]QKE66999.1 hypothetical protein HP562_06570 [Pseudomonas aeruginosa]
MGRKVERKAKPGPAAAQGADDLQILHPEREIEVAGRKLTVREYGFVEGLRLRPMIQPLLDDLYAISQGAVLPDLEQILVVLGQHSDLIPHLMAVAADVDEEWVKGLPHRDGSFLLYVWWLVNGPFFIGAVVDRIQTERAAEEARKAVGQTSMPASSPEDTEPQAPSVE